MDAVNNHVLKRRQAVNLRFCYPISNGRSDEPNGFKQATTAASAACVAPPQRAADNLRKEAFFYVT